MTSIRRDMRSTEPAPGATRRHSVRALAAAGAALVLVLAACSDDDEEGAAADVDATVAPTAAEPQATSAATSGTATATTSDAGVTSTTGATGGADTTEVPVTSAQAAEGPLCAFAGGASATDGTAPADTASATTGAVPATTEAGSTTTSAAGPNAADLIAENESLSTFADAVMQSDTVRSRLEGRRALTVFAPVDEAFEAAGIDVDALTADPAQLDVLLARHVVAGSYTGETLAATPSLQNLAGEPLTFAAEGDTVTVNGTATVGCANLTASNGVVHLIDTVLAQPAEVPPTTAGG